MAAERDEAKQLREREREHMSDQSFRKARNNEAEAIFKEKAKNFPN